MPRSLPPAGVSITASDLWSAFKTAVAGEVEPLDRFREALCRRFKVKHAIFASSGRDALFRLLSAMARLRPGRNVVLLPAYTSFSVPSAAVRAGLKVSLYDVDPETLGPDIESLKRSLSSSTLCVVVCHLYGFPCDMEAVAGALQGSGAYLVDDAAQAMGARFKGRDVGTFGDAGLFSLSRGKNLSTVDGGIIVTDADDLAAAMALIPQEKPEKFFQWRLLGKALALNLLLRPCCYWIPRKLPFLKLGESVFSPDFPVRGYAPCQAAIGLRMLERLGEINAGRRAVAGKLLASLPSDRTKGEIKPIEGAEAVFLRLPLAGFREDRKDDADFGIVRSYPAPLHQIEGLQPHLVGRGDFPGATLLAARIRTLPTHGYVTDEDIATIAALCNERAEGFNPDVKAGA